MMNRLNLLKKELNITDNYEAADTERIIGTVNRRLNKNPSERKVYMKNKFLRTVLVAAVLIAISSLTVFASVYFEWNVKLTEYLKPSKIQMEQMQNMTAFPQVTTADSGITVDILQTLADSHGIYVLYEVSGFGNIGENETLSWKNAHLKISYDKNRTVGMGGYAYNKILDCDNNKCTMLYIRTGKNEVTNQKLAFDLSGLQKSVTDSNGRNYYPVSDCEFNLQWDFQYKNTGKTLICDKKINNGKNTLTQIDVSPISMWITINGDEIKDLNNIKITLKDGGIINPDYNLSFTPLYNGVNIISFEFNKVVSADDIKSVQIGTDYILLGDL